ncbi:MAG TPA: hypothetical protein P5279_13825 [Anaerohalosphaeraceae bacterium]|jgi:hypothetical protein|nr:hypothetical protein [Anaerohalosphaeraceae bacterium]HRT51567.1 hypothetical protein [Anaerohalosphaeraceae bacterium]HRT87598.1 hypothetical protein [Anaerohalosphaeraceae bacterium]
MARDPKRMALYEAIRKGQLKRQGGRRTVLFRPFGSGRGRLGQRRWQDTSLSRLNGAGYSRRRPPGLLRGRLPVSLKRLGVVAVAAALIVVGSTRLWRSRGSDGWFLNDSTPPAEQPGVPGGGNGDNDNIWPSPVRPQRVEVTPVPSAEVAVAPKTDDQPPKEQVKTSQPQGTNVIVIQVYKQRRDLEPVKEHFARYGVETEIVRRGSYFFLVTKQLYHRCSVDSTKFNEKYDGDVARKKIQEIGAKYKAPPGYESFAAHLFSDAYAEKVR